MTERETTPEKVDYSAASPMGQSEWAKFIQRHSSGDRKPIQRRKITSEQLRGLELQSLVFIECDLREVDFSNSRLPDCHFIRCNLAGQVLNGATIANAGFEHCVMDNVLLESSNRVTIRGSSDVVVKNLQITADLEENCLVKLMGEFLDLSLSGSAYSDIVIENALVRNGKFDNIMVVGAFRVSESTLLDCTFADAHVLSEFSVRNDAGGRVRLRCDFSRASLRQSQWHNADLHGSRFIGTDLDYSVFERCKLDRVDFTDCGSLFGRESAVFRNCEGSENATFKSKATIGWGPLRVVQTLPFFGVSYFAIVAVCTYAAALRWVNAQIDSGKAIAPDTGWVRGISPLPVSWAWLLLLVSALMIALGTTIFKLFCPRIIQSQSEEDWRFVLRHPLPEYRGTSISGIQWGGAARFMPGVAQKLQWLVATLFASGAGIALILVTWRVGVSLWYLLSHL